MNKFIFTFLFAPGFGAYNSNNFLDFFLAFLNIVIYLTLAFRAACLIENSDAWRKTTGCSGLRHFSIPDIVY